MILFKIYAGRSIHIVNYPRPKKKKVLLVSHLKIELDQFAILIAML